jgi:hypothetical protein
LRADKVGWAEEDKIMRRSAILLAILGGVLLLDLKPAVAQGFPLYPWCAYYSGGGRGGSTNCYFSTYQQCMAAVSGVGGTCNVNTWYEAYGPYYSFGGAAPPRRKYRRR